MEKYSFFNSIEDDRIYDAGDFALYFSKYFSNGIFNNGLKVKAELGMNIVVESGEANINGYRYSNTDNLSKSIDLADGNQSRIDNVVLRLDLPNRQITIEVIKGDYSDSPIAPSLIRNSTIYDLRLATISVAAGITEITDLLITDCRFNSFDCGNVVQAVQGPDLTEIFDQCMKEVQKATNNIKNILSGDVAGNLLNEINAINSKLITITKNEKLVDKNNNILNPILERYEELKYDLITNGPAVKTGRKVDGKDEWVVRKSAATIKDDNKRINMGLPENAKQIDFDVQISAINSSDVIVKPGYYKNSTDFFMAHGYSNGDVQVQTGSGVQWLNSNMKYFITVFYVLDEVQ